MEKFTKEEKELLEQNPNIQAVLSNQVLYTKDFKEKAVIEHGLTQSMSAPASPRDNAVIESFLDI
ncbi:MAG: hypothetical protein MRZ90_02220 [Candidatus Gastranaerophilales bacterium]|nr:hypothetical protein [Candidatus Gastranaerophilales bacterium]